MTALVFYFQVHQPYRLRPYRFFDIGESSHYFDDAENERIVRRVAQKCYLPMNALIEELVRRSDGSFRCAFSVSGTALQQFRDHAPDVLLSFQRLAATGFVEFLGETSHHSLASLADGQEFADQVRRHGDLVEELLGRRPTVFRNTELICNNAIARAAEELGFLGILGEGADGLLGWRSPHRVYRPEGCERIKLLLRSYQLSDDIAFRFSNRAWAEWPLTADRYLSWLHDLPPDDTFVGLFMDYETFGEHQWHDTGIFQFMEDLVWRVHGDARFRFATPTETVRGHDTTGRIDIPHPVSWADAGRDLGAWLGNPMQQGAHQTLYDLLPRIKSAPEPARAALLEDWRRISTSDHVYYASLAQLSDGDVHAYFSPYPSPHDAYINIMNVLEDLTGRTADACGARPEAAVL
jgi:alpha-amylase